MRRSGALALARGNRRPHSAEKPRTGPVFRGSPRRLLGAAALAALALAAACGRDPEPVPEAPAYVDPGFVEAEGWRLHYALTSTQDLPSAIAGSYGIVQRPNLALLVIALEPREPIGPEDAAGLEVEATAVSLTGERAPLALARRDETGRPTWLATVEVRHRVPITIEIQARATPAGPALRARLTREFRFE
jgi:hypothetical protein